MEFLPGGPARAGASSRIDEAMGPRRSPWLPLLLLVLALALLVIAPFLTQARLASIQREIIERAEPARSAIGKLQRAVALETAGTWGYLLTGDRQLAVEGRQARGDKTAALDELLPLIARLDPRLAEEVEEIRGEVAPEDSLLDALLDGRLSRAAFLESLPAEQARLQRGLERSRQLDQAVVGHIGELRGQFDRLHRLGMLIETALILIAGAIVVSVARLMQAYRSLAERMEQHAVRQAWLREVARTLGESPSVQAAVDTIVSHAIEATHALGAYVERTEAPYAEVEVVAAAGDGIPAAGTRVPYPGSLTEAIARSGEPSLVTEVGQVGDPMASYLRTCCERCSGLVVPLASEETRLGALVLLRRGGAPRFSDDEIGVARALGDLASVALRRLRLLDAERRARAQAEKDRRELERVTESRARLLRGFSHDVKNPLSAVDGYLQLMERRGRGLDPTVGTQVEKARRSLGAALELIDDLLEHERGARDEVRMKKGLVDLGEILRTSAEAYGAQAGAAGLALRTHVQTGLPPILSDRRRILQILGNLLSNAVKYTDRGEIRIEARKVWSGGPAAGRWIAIDVIDTGRGISPDQKRMLFQEFRRLDSSKRTSGTGIGLSMAQSLAHALGGTITVQSELGAGSSFTLWLPLVPV